MSPSTQCREARFAAGSRVRAERGLTLVSVRVQHAETETQGREIKFVWQEGNLLSAQNQLLLKGASWGPLGFFSVPLDVAHTKFLCHRSAHAFDDASPCTEGERATDLIQVREAGSSVS